MGTASGRSQQPRPDRFQDLLQCREPPTERGLRVSDATSETMIGLAAIRLTLNRIAPA
jgi:hypothetical protein